MRRHWGGDGCVWGCDGGGGGVRGNRNMAKRLVTTRAVKFRLYSSIAVSFNLICIISPSKKKKINRRSNQNTNSIPTRISNEKFILCTSLSFLITNCFKTKAAKPTTSSFSPKKQQLDDTNFMNLLKLIFSDHGLTAWSLTAQLLTVSSINNPGSLGESAVH